MADPVMWGIHAGKHGDVDALFLEHGVVALGWAEMGDLTRLPKDREAFKTELVRAYPAMSAAAIANWAGQLFRFVHEMKPGDQVVYRSRATRHVHIGQISGPYRYDPSVRPTYPNRRVTSWLNSLPVTAFSQAALYEIGSAMSLFQVRNYADEFRALLGGGPATPVTPVAGSDDTIPLVVEQTEENTRDFIHKQLLQELKGHPLADFVAHLLNQMGFRTRTSSEGPDAGIDIVAHKDELGFEPPIVKVQVKSTVGSTGDPEVSSFCGKVAASEHGLFVTLGTFTAQARNYARSQPNLRLIDGDGLVAIVLAHYEQLDSRYRAVIPLKRVYVPDREESVPG